MRQAYKASAEDLMRFDKLRTIIGADLTVFIMCAYCDVPYNPRIAASGWEQYLRKNNKQDGKFSDGVTDVFQAVEAGMADMERWQKVWGVGDDSDPYSPADYRRLDEIFRRYTSRLNASGGYDALQEDTLRHCSRMALLRDKNVAKGDKESIDKAQKLDKMIQENLSSENLRRKDEKPTQTARLDGIVEAMKKKYGVGIEMTHEQALEVFRKWCSERRYSCSIDAAEQSILAIINCMRNNSDMPQLSELPQDARLDLYENEFSKSAAGKEKEVYTYLQLERRDRNPRR